MKTTIASSRVSIEHSKYKVYLSARIHLASFKCWLELMPNNTFSCIQLKRICQNCIYFIRARTQRSYAYFQWAPTTVCNLFCCHHYNNSFSRSPPLSLFLFSSHPLSLSLSHSLSISFLLCPFSTFFVLLNFFPLDCSFVIPHLALARRLPSPCVSWIF